MLRQGKHVNDFCLYLGDDIPVRILGHKLPDFPQGYDFDAFTTDALKNRMAVKNGRIVLPDGVSYSMIILPSDGKLGEDVKRLIDDFDRQGVPVYDPQTDSRTLSQFASDHGMLPDVDAPKAENLYFCHRRTENEDIYFLNNHSDQEVNDHFLFRSAATSAELWNPVTGERTALAMTTGDGRTHISLTLRARESLFIILNKGPEKTNSRTLTPRAAAHDAYGSIAATGGWKVTFDKNMGGPAEPVTFEKLTDWTKSTVPLIKYYSGTAVCENTFILKKKDRRAAYHLRVSLLNAAAKVIVNGQQAGIVWCSPWEIDITKHLKKGKNHVELHIANTMWNRLVGDARLPEADRITWQTYMLSKPTDILVPSGLKNSVEIKMYK